MRSIGRDDVVAYLTGRGHVPHQAVVLGGSRVKGKIRVRVTWYPASLVSDRDVPLETLEPWSPVHAQMQDIARQTAKAKRDAA